MTDNNARRPRSADGHPGESAANDTAAPNEAAAAGGSAEAPAAEVAEMKDRLLRTLAEMENLRRRTEREVLDTRAYGISAFARDVLGVSDNLRRALDAVEAERASALPKGAIAFIEGVELTERELLKVLEKHGVRRFEPLGEKFDPNVHQAMFEVPDPSAPAGTVVRVVQAGFMIGERVLRPAMVGVAKGGPKHAQPAAGPDPASETQNTL